MVVERRAFNRLPCYLQTDQNNRDTYISDDVMFEPERAGFIKGFIGDSSILTPKDLERSPLVAEATPERQKYQLSLGAVFVNPDTSERSGGAFYLDLVRQIDANGGITSDPNRLFGTPFYAWTPPIDYDKHINFTRYYWTGDGNAEVNGEYVTKEAQGSQTILYEVASGAFVSREATISTTAPAGPAVGDLWEDASTPNRIVFRWDGSAWQGVPFFVEESLPTDTSAFIDGDHVYVTRTGPAFNRPLVWKYSEEAGRWIAQPVIVGPTPDNPAEGMVWEDTVISPNRVLKVFQNGLFTDLAWTSADGPSGIAADNTYVYDTRQISAITDGWSAQNFWRHFEDLSPADRKALVAGDQAVRPILEFWAGIEPVAGDTRDSRNDIPMFKTFGYNFAADEIQESSTATTLFQYQVGTGVDDSVIGFPLVFNQTGEFQFELTLETDDNPDVTGYRYFRDQVTGLAHSIWAKSDTVTEQAIDSDGLADVPVSITSNADHDILTVASRARMLKHMSDNIEAQTGIIGNKFGLNSYRWTDKSPTVGTTIIDCENALLRALATLQNNDLSIPDVIRRISRDYNRVLVKFENRLIQRWNDNTLSDVAGNLLVTPDEAVDSILTELFVGQNEEFRYFYSDMGTYTETQVSAGTAVVIGTSPRPIFIPPSPARVGAAQSYRPGSFVDRDGKTRVRGHEGVVIESFGDARDDVWLALQTRFYNQVPAYYREETVAFSARHATSNFWLADYYGNSTPTTTVDPVDQVVVDHTAIPAPAAGTVVFDTTLGVYAYYDGIKFLTRTALEEDVFFNRADNEYYTYNGFGGFQIDRFNNAFAFDYTQEEFRQILRREFERWAVSSDADFVTNTAFDESDPFTWNYRSAGVEGHYQGIYSRLYRTTRPHSHPWEIVGYSTEPDWWRTSYVPTSTEPDGTPRYANTHPMWADFQAGIYNPLSGAQSTQFVMAAPIPVDVAGELLDPISAGVVDQEKLVYEQRDDNWIYGDGAPIEQGFIVSPYYSFAIALQGYLMKPGLFVDTLWSELYIDVGLNGPNPVWRAPHVVHRDTLTRPKLADLPVHLEVINGATEQRLGINAWISEYTRILGNDVTNTFGDTIRNTQIAVGWRCSGFINQDRTIIQTLSGVRVPFEDVHTLLHRSPPIRESFASGVLVTREGTGYRVFGFDLFSPFFEIDIPVSPINGGQVELREDITAAADQHNFTVTNLTLPRNVQNNETARLSVLVNGLRLKPQHITVLDGQNFQIEEIVTINSGDVVTPVVLTTQSNPSTRVKQFQIEGVSFPYVDQGQGVTRRIEYGRFFETAPDVINFMLAYGRKLEQEGWLFEDSEDTTAIRDWLFGAKQFATWVLNTESPWKPDGPSTETDFFFSPFARKAKFESTFGQVLNVEAVQNGAYGVIDQNAFPINPNDIFTSRIGNTITMTGNDDAPDMFGARLLVAEDQHVVFLSNVTRFNDLIYDPVIALFQSTLRLDAYRSQDWNGRLEADGFVINEGFLLPNFEKQARDFVRYYDRFDTLDDPVKRDQARELYGWYPNNQFTPVSGEPVSPLGSDPVPMMDALASDERARFDYHRGMIHAKGTIRPIIAFSRGTCLGRDSVIVNEDWAWRWCEFGDTRRDVVQFAVERNDFRDQAQVIEFNVADNITDSVLQIPEFDRSAPNDSRWIIPPIFGEDSQCCAYRFPVNTNGTFDTETTRFFVKLFDRDTNLAVLRMFHYDPQNGLFDPQGQCEIDYVNPLDPARYSNGGGASYSNQSTWGAEQVGQLWWNTDARTYMDYRSLAPDYARVASEWGNLTYFKGSITRTDEVVTVVTSDPYTGAVSNHNLTTGDQVVISGATPVEYNGAVTVTVTSDTTFQFEVNQELDTPATGDIRIQTGFINVYEWMESPVVPSDWVTFTDTLTEPGSPTGVPINGDATSFVTRTTLDDRGNTTTLYYFWVEGNTGTNPEKSETTSQIASRLENPTANNNSWFSHIDPARMVVFTDGERVDNDYAIEILQDQRKLEHHVEWLLISEGDQSNDVPEIIRNKLLDSLAGQDTGGREVPSALLADTEKLGTDEFPPQTVFVDRPEAINVFVTAINKILNRKNLDDVGNLAALFPLTDENLWWRRANYRAEDQEDANVLDTVATEQVAQDRLARGRYVEGDLVTVVQAGSVDLWDGTTVPNTTQITGGQLVEVGVNNHTLNLILDGNTDPTVLRNAFDRAYGLLTKVEQNSLIFSLLYEMMRQTPEADWFMKTSYITMQIFDTVGQTPFVRPDETQAVIANALDLKPYRTKLRSSTLTFTIDQIENMGVQIDEFPDKKITLCFDRLACDNTEDGGWDSYAWDIDPEGWDTPLWDYIDLGRQQWNSLGVQIGTVQSTYVFDSPFDPTLYGHQLILTRLGEVIQPNDIGLTATLLKSHSQVTVTFSGTLSPDFTVEVQQAAGFYEGMEPTLGPDFENTLFQPAPSSYKHHVARMLEQGIQAPFPSMDACYTTTEVCDLNAPTTITPFVSDDGVTTGTSTQSAGCTVELSGSIATTAGSAGASIMIMIDGSGSINIVPAALPNIIAKTNAFLDYLETIVGTTPMDIRIIRYVSNFPTEDDPIIYDEIEILNVTAGADFTTLRAFMTGLGLSPGGVAFDSAGYVDAIDFFTNRGTKSPVLISISDGTIVGAQTGATIGVLLSPVGINAQIHQYLTPGTTGAVLPLIQFLDNTPADATSGGTEAPVMTDGAVDDIIATGYQLSPPPTGGPAVTVTGFRVLVDGVQDPSVGLADAAGDVFNLNFTIDPTL